MKNILLCVINTLMMAVGQILFKLGSNGKKITRCSDLIPVVFSPTIILALVMYGFSTLLWIYILSKVRLSFAYPIQALAFPIVLMMSALIFHEGIPVNRWVGVIVIITGVYIAIYK